tara:strand:+ start:121 stop:462 length:342 start_codon:yes stop_codon:yes gene_type:complete
MSICLAIENTPLKVVAKLNKKEVLRNELFEYTIIITNYSKNIIIDQDIFEEFTLYKRSTSHSYTMEDNILISKQKNIFTLSPNKIGLHVIPTSSITINNQSYSLNSKGITVKK